MGGSGGYNGGHGCASVHREKFKPLGGPDGGNGGNSSAVASSLASGVSQIYSTLRAFAALKSDGSVVTWGNGSDGGNSSAVASSLSSGVSQIYSTGFAFAALKSDGSVITWGSSSYGGDSSAVTSSLSSGVSLIYGTGAAGGQSDRGGYHHPRVDDDISLAVPGHVPAERAAADLRRSLGLSFD